METANAPTGIAEVQSGESPVADRIIAPYGATFGADAAAFSQSMGQAEVAASEASARSNEVPAVVEAVFEPLERINGEAGKLAAYAQEALASGDELTASEIVLLTVRSHEFMFHAQLTANVANRTADGMQQLFRQQG